MNERIFELAEQAENYATTRHPVSNIALSVNNEKFVKKFAELIVAECASVAGKYIHENKYTENGVSDFWLKETIKEHFGVEE